MSKMSKMSKLSTLMIDPLQKHTKKTFSTTRPPCNFNCCESMDRVPNGEGSLVLIWIVPESTLPHKKNNLAISCRVFNPTWKRSTLPGVPKCAAGKGVLPWRPTSWRISSPTKTSSRRRSRPQTDAITTTRCSIPVDKDLNKKQL